MRCTDNNRRKRMRARRRRQKRILRIMILCLLLLIGGAVYLFVSKFTGGKALAAKYEAEHYNASIYKGKLFAEDLCVVSEDIDSPSGPDTSSLTSAGLFDVEGANTQFAFNVHEELYPASVTKILTALLAIENADLSEEVTTEIGAEDFAPDESVANIRRGDMLTLDALLYGLLLESGNDCAEAIAYHVAGSLEDFADMMNERAAELMATNTHFKNPSGLHDDDHYTTAYDVYLIFNECIKHEEFVKIIGTDSYTADITGADGVKRSLVWKPSHFYAQQKASLPSAADVVGGKTGTTKKAGNCLVLLNRTKEGRPFISVVMGAETKDILYADMTKLINGIAVSE